MANLFEDRTVRREQRGRDFATPVPVKVPVVATAVLVVLAVVAALTLGIAVTQALLVGLAALGTATLVAHRTVTSTLAGVALLVVRPYSEGERVRIAWPAQDGFLEAVVVHIGLANTTLASDTGVLVIPNNRLLRNPPLSAPSAEPPSREAESPAHEAQSPTHEAEPPCPEPCA
jgi:small-conductance mechanosensitive channel